MNEERSERIGVDKKGTDFRGLKGLNCEVLIV